MTESNAVAASPSGLPTPPSVSRSRIHFSDDQGSSGPDISPRPSRSGAGSPFLPKSNQTSRGASSRLGDDGRKRVRSLAAKSLLSDTSVFGAFPAKRSMDTARGPGGDKDPLGFIPDPALDVFGPGALSDEYDLYPKILKDVQHALKLKARREARLQGLPQGSPSKEMPPRASTSSDPSVPPSAQIVFPSTASKSHTTSSTMNTSKSSEIDFSPSTGITALHPVPLSSNGGATLDWTGSFSDEEKHDRKWTLSITRAKSKDKLPLASKAIVEKQDSIFTDKIARIKAEAKPHTLRKAAITSEQLQRRYDLVYKSINGSARVNPASAVRWYATSSLDLQASLDEAEPLTWLKHLLDRRSRNSTIRLPWHLTALIVEEYVRSQSRSDMMETIPEDPGGASPTSQTQSPPSVPYLVRSRPSSHNSFAPSISRRLSYEGHVSFEPYMESTRTSLEGESRRSGDGNLRAWRHSLPGVADSPHSSLYSSNQSVSSNINNRPDMGRSPDSGRLQIRDLAGRVCRRTYGSEDSSASTRNSQSEDQSRSDGGNSKRRKVRRNSRPPDLAFSPVPGPGSGAAYAVRSRPVSEADDDPDSNIDAPLTVKARHATLSDEEPTAMMRSDSKVETSAEPPASATTPRAWLRRKGIHMSLPSARILEEVEQKRHRHQDEADEEKERHEYEHKAQLLGDAMARNHRIRQALQRVAAGVREYDLLQTNLMKSLGVPHRSIPPELLDAFSHDPAAVTGATRRWRGWRAVEDIHNRVTRQRETFGIFLSMSQAGFPPPDSVFDEPITSLSQTLDKLEGHREATTTKAREVAGILTSVKGIHASVKTEYNETLSHTSVVYPELSQIIALEESYKDQYQQLWEFGMDTLTFILDTVTPFWRTYGKTIGEDVQDFLVIPLYRNEFTGETKRYPISGLPKRSYRRWLGLMLFFFVTVGVTMLQSRATMTFLSYYRLPWHALNGFRWAVMPFFCIAALIQICAVFIELCIVFAQLGVLAWWVGWLLKIFT